MKLNKTLKNKSLSIKRGSKLKMIFKRLNKKKFQELNKNRLEQLFKKSKKSNS